MRETVFRHLHEAAGARMVDFAGWYMPVQYEGIVAEHVMVRSAAGMFDVSHMGRILVSGPEHEKFVDHIATNERAGMRKGQIRYNLICNEGGTILDDVLIYAGLGSEIVASEQSAADPGALLQTAATMIVCNAGNHPKIIDWVRSHAKDFDVAVHDVSETHAMLALQGPNSQKALQKVTDVDLATIRYYRLKVGKVLDCPNVVISRTGYTGEDGFELIFPNQQAEMYWNGLLAAGSDHGLNPAGLGARDTLRLEAGMPLYGHEIDDTITPLEAGLDWAVKLDKSEGFIGSGALKDSSVDRKLIGLKIEGKRIARQGASVLHDGKPVGEVMSGTKSPTLGYVIATTMVPASVAESGDRLQVEIKAGQQTDAEQVSPQFYRRER